MKIFPHVRDPLYAKYFYIQAKIYKTKRKNNVYIFTNTNKHMQAHNLKHKIKVSLNS